MEVSIDEPLNVDWDGNELLLSDILGTDEDVIYRDMETEVEYKLLFRAIANFLTGADDRQSAIWSGTAATVKKRRRKKWQISSAFRSLIFQDWRKRLRNV